MFKYEYIIRVEKWCMALQIDIMKMDPIKKIRCKQQSALQSTGSSEDHDMYFSRLW